jgi:hypothetical protein
VRWQRSVKGAADDKPEAYSGLAETLFAKWKIAPHSVQNFEPGTSLLPQAGQLSANAEPH